MNVTTGLEAWQILSMPNMGDEIRDKKLCTLLAFGSVSCGVTMLTDCFGFYDQVWGTYGNLYSDRRLESQVLPNCILQRFKLVKRCCLC
jgi:hypothetical protein